MKFDLDKEDSEFLKPLFKWGFFGCSVASFIVYYILSEQMIEEFDHWFLLFSIICLIISLKFTKEDKKEKDNNGNFEL